MYDRLSKMSAKTMQFRSNGASNLLYSKRKHLTSSLATESNDNPSKSPRYMRKKRFQSAQARKPHSVRELMYKDSNIESKPLAHRVETSGKSNIKKSDEDEGSIPSSKMLGHPKYSEIEDSSFQIINQLKRSVSLPSLHSESYNLVSSQGASTQACISQHSAVHLQSEASDALSALHCDLGNENGSINCSSNCSSSENIVNNCGISRRSSTSTVRERNNSNDSAFSLISIIDVKEIEEAAFAEQEILIKKSFTGPHYSRSKSAIYEPKHSDSIEDIGVFSLPSSLSESKAHGKKSIFEGRQMVAPTECFFPRPQQGQSLTSFLSSNEFNISAELDRENAHFCISEALISAIEHMKCSQTMKFVEEEEESDEEIRKLTQRIRIRKREKQREKQIRNLVLLSDGKTDTTTSQSASPPASSQSSDYEVSIGSEDEVEDLELSNQTESNLSSIKENGLSLSMASLYSDADIQRIPFLQKDSNAKKPQDFDSNLSAESVALSLLKKFSEKHLPKASELQWLVSEQDAPQRLLPLPDSWPVSPDVIEEEYNLEKTRLRGNFEWAPPRPQIIFSIHCNAKKQDTLEKQKYRCAGCGMKIERIYINRFRYCEYFGKYFCQCCHSNSLAYIPSRILWKWNFTKYYVSKFAWNLLDQMFYDPLFSIVDINSNLYQKVRQLELCRTYRIQLFYLKDFIKTCRKAELIQGALENQSYIIHEPHKYSLSDLVQVKSGELTKRLCQLVNHCLDHVKQCILCQAKGFICEICNKDKDVIYPFQLDKVDLCEACRSCFHKRCYKKVKCPKCIRIEERKKRLKEVLSDEEYI